MNKQDIKKAASQVIALEAEALREMSRNLPDDFADIVRVLMSIEGRIIVTGMGKSGHIARKIAATMASTGTPAFFVHPAEASHGDLGMITPRDAIIILSNSGETRELAHVIYHARQLKIPMVAITKRADSTLAKKAGHALILPDVPEACAIGMAPTTSTTCALALGDALAVAMMKERGFSKENFSAFHPSGSLGAQLLKVRDVMHTGEELPLVPADAAMRDVLPEMTAKSFGTAAVVRNGKLHGVITDGDLRRHMEGLLDSTAADVATVEPITVKADVLLGDALKIMREKKISALFITDDDARVKGLIHIHDILRAGVK